MLASTKPRAVTSNLAQGAAYVLRDTANGTIAHANTAQNSTSRVLRVANPRSHYACTPLQV